MDLAKHKDWILLNIPCFLMSLYLLIYPSNWEDIIIYAGYTSVILLVILLSLNPLIRKFKDLMILRQINRHRRIIGVAVFTYAALHVACYIVKKKGIDILFWIRHPVLLPGLITFIILLALAVTSNHFSIKKLTIQKWKKLHRRVYIAEATVFLHLLSQLIFFDKTRTIYILLALCSLFILQRVSPKIQRHRIIH